MRPVLDWIYRGSRVLAGIFLVLIAATVLAQIVGRLFGVLVRGADVISVYFMVAAAFLALGPTLRSGGHIRVALLLRGLGVKLRRAFELWCLGVGSLITIYFTYYAVDLVWGSYLIGESAIGLVAVPLWIPRSAMALGVLVLAIAFVEEFLRVLLGDEPTYGYRESSEGQSETEIAEGPPGVGRNGGE